MTGALTDERLAELAVWAERCTPGRTRRPHIVHWLCPWCSNDPNPPGNPDEAGAHEIGAELIAEVRRLRSAIGRVESLANDLDAEARRVLGHVGLTEDAVAARLRAAIRGEAS